MKIQNYMEIVVENLVNGTIVNMDTCKCDKCKSDIKALALNNLPTKYVSSDEGASFVEIQTLQSQFEADVVKELTLAAVVVSNNKKHI